MKTIDIKNVRNLLSRKGIVELSYVCLDGVSKKIKKLHWLIKDVIDSQRDLIDFKISQDEHMELLKQYADFVLDNLNFPEKERIPQEETLLSLISNQPQWIGDKFDNIFIEEILEEASQRLGENWIVEQIKSLMDDEANKIQQ
jgi:hypothetical protein